MSRMTLARLQMFQRRTLEHKGPPSEPIAVSMGELHELVHEVFALRNIIGEVHEATTKAKAEGWTKSCLSSCDGRKSSEGT